jgi:hypothetical protein
MQKRLKADLRISRQLLYCEKRPKSMFLIGPSVPSHLSEQARKISRLASSNPTSIFKLSTHAITSSPPLSPHQHRGQTHNVSLHLPRRPSASSIGLPPTHRSPQRFLHSRSCQHREGEDIGGRIQGFRGSIEGDFKRWVCG